jgi:hypothetical protein
MSGPSTGQLPLKGDQIRTPEDFAGTYVGPAHVICGFGPAVIRQPDVRAYLGLNCTLVRASRSIFA